MCEMLGFSSLHRKNILPYLKEFFSHGVSNPNGWGLAEFNGEAVSLTTESVSSAESDLLPGLLKEDSAAQTVLAHIRKATVGGVNPKNCHPFTLADKNGHIWYLMHNGTVFSGMKLIQYREKQSGDTDSERILMYLVDRINEAAAQKGQELNSFERFKVVEQVTEQLSYRNKLNLIIYDGQQMYVHANMKNTLYLKDTDNGILFATVPLDNDGWSPLPLTILFVYRDGKLLYRGKNHHNEYIDVISAVAQKYDYNI